METLINKNRRGNSFLRGFTSRDPINATIHSEQQGLEAFLSETDERYVLEIPRALTKDKEIELGLGDDHLTLFLSDQKKEGHEYHSIIFSERVDPENMVADQGDEVFKVTIPKLEEVTP